MLKIVSAMIKNIKQMFIFLYTGQAEETLVTYATQSAGHRSQAVYSSAEKES